MVFATGRVGSRVLCATTNGRPWRLDSNKKVSGKPGAVQTIEFEVTLPEQKLAVPSEGRAE